MCSAYSRYQEFSICIKKKVIFQSMHLRFVTLLASSTKPLSKMAHNGLTIGSEFSYTIKDSYQLNHDGVRALYSAN